MWYDHNPSVSLMERKGLLQYSRLVLASLLLAFLVPNLHAATPVDECLAFRHHGREADAHACFSRLLSSSNPYFRAEGYWGLEQYTEARDAFQAALKAEPQNPEYRVRFGRMLLERFNPQDAAGLFNEALGIRKDYAPALVGLALIASQQFESSAVYLAQKALASDPKLVEAQELLARFALEDSNTPKAIEEADKAIAMSGEALDAMTIRATIDWMSGKTGTPWMDRILKVNPSYGQAYATAAYFFVINRRYEEGIDFYKKAIALSPRLWEAHSELGINLMRLGQNQEARQQLELCYDNGYRNAATVNTLRLMDSYKNFVTFKDGDAIEVLNRKEADLLHPYVEAQMKRDIADYQIKYKMKLDRPVQVEMYPDHEDFAVRTMGMPGLGALGVTFDYVIAMDSPSGRKPGSFHWASTLRHEMSHVFVLAATNHLAPRWFGEGLAVYEETAASPDWGDRLDPDAIMAMKQKKLLPIAGLDRGFVRPQYPSQVVVSYFQAGKICGYIASKWGYDKLLEMMHAFGTGASTPEVVQQTLGMAPEAFDKEFFTWLYARYQPTLDHFDEWRKRIQSVASNVKAKNWDEVIREGNEIRDMYPDYVEDGNVYEFLSDAYLAKGNKEAAMAQLERYSTIGGRSPYLIKQLASLQAEAGKKHEAAESLTRLLYIYPVEDEDLHQRLGDLWMDLGKPEDAILEFQSVLALHPADQATAHYNLARAFQAAKRVPEAKEQVLLSLEAAPDFRPAQKMLLDLTQ
jgi:tetratricopeptide (TPR) repeat protein